MPKGPQGQRLPAAVMGNEMHFARIVSDKEQGTRFKQPAKRKSGLAGTKAHQRNTAADERKATARRSANVRWE